MKTVQCTFRLPRDVVKLIDKQQGKTRTDKLLSLIKSINDENVTGVINSDYNDLEYRLTKVEETLNQLALSQGSVRQNVQSPSLNSANKRKSEESNNRIKEAVKSLTEEQRSEAVSSRYPVSKVREFTGLTKGMTDGKTDLIVGWLTR